MSAGLSDKAVESLLADREGNIWVGTQRGGLNRLSPRQVTCYDERWGLGQVAILSVAEVGRDLWACTLGQGIRRSSEQAFVPLAPGILSNYPYANPLLLARDNSCWVSTGAGLLHFNTNAQVIPGEADLVQGLGSAITALAEDGMGGLWLGTAAGELWRLASGNLTCQSNVLSTQEISALARQPDGTLWVGSAGSGLVRLQNGRTTHYGRGEGLHSSFIRTLHLEASGTLWIGTAGGGLSRWRDGKLATFTTREGLLDDTVSQVLEDDAGYLWLGCNRGIARVSKEELEQLASGRTASVCPLLLGRFQGVPGECTGGYHPAGLKTGSGALVFATTKGIVLIHPANPVYDVPPPPALIEEVLVDGRPATGYAYFNAATQDHAPLRIPPGNHRYEFHFTALNLTSPEWVRFRYKLEGLGSEWIDVGRERTVEFAHLPAGDYRFRVISSNGSGRWEENGASLAFTVSPFFWQQLWFQALLLCLGLTLACWMALRVAQRRHRLAMAHAEQQRLVESERTRIARDIHDQLGASLTRISLLSDLAEQEAEKPDQVAVHLKRVNETALESIQAMDAIVWAVNPRNDTLQSLVEYLSHLRNELFEETPTRCRLDLPSNLPALPLSPHARHNLFLVAREALHNVLKHAHASEVTLQVTVSRGVLEIIVRDNGCGFDFSPNGVHQTGLENMRHRVEGLQGRLTIDTSPSCGTTVRICVPVLEGVTAAR
jgi:signal transduction histidine kinase/sugar lactone lactonase YvrE